MDVISFVIPSFSSFLSFFLKQTFLSFFVMGYNTALMSVPIL